MFVAHRCSRGEQKTSLFWRRVRSCRCEWWWADRPWRPAHTWGPPYLGTWPAVIWSLQTEQYYIRLETSSYRLLLYIGVHFGICCISSISIPCCIFAKIRQVKCIHTIIAFPICIYISQAWAFVRIMHFLQSNINFEMVHSQFMSS